MTPVTRVDHLTDLLAVPGVVEEHVAGSRIGVCSLHGGGLGRTTDVVAREVAARTGASFYGVIQPDGSRHHLPSTRFDPAHSGRLADFLDGIDVVVSIHGYGRDDDFWAVLLGGSNRDLAHHTAGCLRGHLPGDYRVVDDLDLMPRNLRGVHPRNPVNRPAHGGVQVELPPPVRWNRDTSDWSSADDDPRPEQLDALIDGLVEAVDRWAQ